MGCDIHVRIEKKAGPTRYEAVTDAKFGSSRVPFDWRCYRTFGFLAGVRNYSGVPPIARQRGFPGDASADVRKTYDLFGWNAHSASWLSITELSEFEYDRPVEDRCVQRDNGVEYTCAPGEGIMTTYREFLGQSYFEDLEILKHSGIDRVVFWFDN